MIETTAKCPECLRVFDLLDEDEAHEAAYGHDCEADGPRDDEWIGRAYERQAPARTTGYYDGGRLVRA